MLAKSVYNDLIGGYVDKTPLVGQAFTTDAAKVHTYIFRFTSRNEVTKSKIVALATKTNGRLDFMALKDHYEGVGVHVVNVVQVEKY